MAVPGDFKDPEGGGGCCACGGGVIPPEERGCRCKGIGIGGAVGLVILPGNVHFLGKLLHAVVLLPGPERVERFESRGGNDPVGGVASYGPIVVQVVHLEEGRQLGDTLLGGHELLGDHRDVLNLHACDGVLVVVAIDLLPAGSIVVGEEPIVLDRRRLDIVGSLLPEGCDVGLNGVDLGYNRLDAYEPLTDIVDPADDRGAALPTVAFASRFLCAPFGETRLMPWHYEK